MSKFEPLERPNFFFGRLLSIEDLQLEQEYVLARLRRLNRLVHGWGVVTGLGVSKEGSNTVVVQPGVAIDCMGNEIVLGKERKISLTAFVGRRYLVIGHAEVGVDEVVTASGTQHAKLRESVHIELVHLNPSANHRGRILSTIGCGLAHPLCLATISRHDSRWRVTAFFHRTSSKYRC